MHNMKTIFRGLSAACLPAVFAVLAGCAATGGGYGYDRYDDPGRDVYACNMCGVVQDIDPVQYRGDDTAALGTIIGAVIGAAAGNQVGSGSGRKAATVGGAIAGGIIGHEVDQRNDNMERGWRVVVRLDNGRYATVTQDVRPRADVGDYVQVRDDRVYRR